MIIHASTVNSFRFFKACLKKRNRVGFPVWSRIFLCRARNSFVRTRRLSLSVSRFVSPELLYYFQNAVRKDHMRACIQRVSMAKVELPDQNNRVSGQIEKGFLVLLGVGQEDEVEDAVHIVVGDVEELRPGLFLDLPDHLAERWLGDAQNLRGFADASFLQDRQHVFQLSVVHGKLLYPVNSFRCSKK